MKLKFVVPEMKETFGRLEFAGEGEVIQRRNPNGRGMMIESRTYNLYSSIQRADNIEVMLPGSVSEKTFDYEDEVILINPSIEVKGAGNDGVAYADYILKADDMKKA